LQNKFLQFEGAQGFFLTTPQINSNVKAAKKVLSEKTKPHEKYIQTPGYFQMRSRVAPGICQQDVGVSHLAAKAVLSRRLLLF
jgi:hypothetical protein